MELFAVSHRFLNFLATNASKILQLRAQLMDIIEEQNGLPVLRARLDLVQQPGTERGHRCGAAVL
jgi:hypothetical protein